MRRPAAVDMMLLATVILWAFNFTVTKYVLTHGFRPLAYSGTRYGAAAILFAGLTWLREGSLRVHARDLPLLLGAAGGALWLNQLAYVYAIKFTTASTVALVLGSTPIFAAMLARAVGLEELTRVFWIAAVASFAGVALIAIGRGSVATDLKGVLLAIGTAATWAAYSVAVAHLMPTYSAWRISAIVLLVTWVGLLAVAAPQLAGQTFHLGWLTWAAFAYAVVGPLLVTNLLWFTAIDRVGPSRAALFGNLQPFFAVIIALLVLSERLTTLEIAGGFAIAIGIVLERRVHRVTPAPPAD